MNKFLLTVLFINLIFVPSVFAQEGFSLQSDEPKIQITQLEDTPKFLWKVTPILPGSFTSRNKVSFKISNVGVVKTPSFLFQVHLIDPDNNLMWEGGNSVGTLSPTQKITLKFYIPVKEIKFGNYKLRYRLINAHKTIENEIDIPSAISSNLKFDQQFYKTNERMNMNLELVNTGKFCENIEVITIIPSIQFSASKRVFLCPTNKITIPYRLSLPSFISPGTYTVKVDLKSANSISHTFDFVITFGDEYIIGPLDILEIFVMEDPDLTQTVAVTPDGKISLPVIGDIPVAGMTLIEISKKITSLLSGRDYLVNPSVTVFLRQINSKKFSIIGEVEKPGVFPVSEEVTLLKAIALAGGLTKFADLHAVKIFRPKNGVSEIIKIDVNKIIKKGKLEENITIQPEDIIVVPESLF